MEIDEPERALEFESEFLKVEHPWIQQFSFTSRIIHVCWVREKRGEERKEAGKRFEILFGFYGEAVFSEMMLCDGNVDGSDWLTMNEGAVTDYIGASLRRRLSFRARAPLFLFALNFPFKFSFSDFEHIPLPLPPLSLLHFGVSIIFVFYILFIKSSKYVSKLKVG